MSIARGDLCFVQKLLSILVLKVRNCDPPISQLCVMFLPLEQIQPSTMVHPAKEHISIPFLDIFDHYIQDHPNPLDS